MMTFGSLFAGIGGFDLGLERAGMKCLWQVEIDPFCRKVLTKHWPEVLKYEDVREVGKHNLEHVDLICGGFPCQDISFAGKGGGLEGKRSGLWFEFFRIFCELRPKYLLVENVPAILIRGLNDILASIASVGYNAEWEVLSAGGFKAPHSRDRLFLVAYPYRIRRNSERIFKDWLYSEYTPQLWESFRTNKHEVWLKNFCGLSRDDDGVPDRVDRIKSCGNAVVSQIAEYIGKNIVEANQSLEADGQKDGHRSA